MPRTWKVKGKGLYREERVYSSKYFLQKNCVSCGWGDPGTTHPEIVVDFQSYKDKWIEMYGMDKKWNYQGVHHLFERVQKGDFLWTRLDGEYYVAEVPDDPINLFHLDLSQKAAEYDSSVQLKNIHWIKCGTEDTVPGSISTFSSNRNAIVRVDNNETETNGYTATSLFSRSVIYPDSIEPLSDKNMIFRFFGPSGFEDIIALWLYDSFQYIVIPSTNKKSTQTYEFVLVDGTKEHGTYTSSRRIYLQAKNGKTNLSLSDYKDLLREGDELWLVTSRGNVCNLDGQPEKHKMMQYIKNGTEYRKNGYPLSSLIDFVFDDSKSSILPRSILYWKGLFL